MSVIQNESMRIFQQAFEQLEIHLQLQPFERSVEAAFIALKSCWVQLKQVLTTNDFDSEEEEIHFFKVVKPTLIAELEYYGLVYHSILFCPPDVEQSALFWQREANRLEEFKILYADFYCYYASGATHLDACYFKRKPAYDPDATQSETRAKTTHDHLISKLLAFEKYARFALSHLPNQ